MIILCECGHSIRDHGQAMWGDDKADYCRLCRLCDCHERRPVYPETDIPATEESNLLFEKIIDSVNKFVNDETNTHLSESEKYFVGLDKLKDAMKKFFAVYDHAAAVLEIEKGLGHHFQDDDGTVYKVDYPTGTYYEFKNHGVKRTRRKDIGEKQGSLNLTEARDAGFIVEGKGKKKK